MSRFLVPATMVAAMVAFATAALTVGSVPSHPAWWRGAVSLAVLGGIVPMIAAVNIRVVPVFARRQWPSPAWLRAQVGLAIAGAWTVYAGRLATERSLVVAGSALALAGGLVFAANVVRLFRQPAVLPPSPLPFPQQAVVDRLATRFTRLSGLYLLVGLGVGLAIEIWPPRSGRWDLVWAHAMLVGFFLTMAAGVSYHVLSRWTGRPWRAVALIRLHLLIVTIGLPLMLAALATNRSTLFEIAGPLQAAALALFLATVAPMVPALPEPTRTGIAGAGLFLLTGIGLGSAFAADPALGARLRMVHAEVNLFGWTGLLISGVGYYLVPRFLGRPLRWPRLAVVQIAALAGGTLLGAVALAMRAYGKDTLIPVAWTQVSIALGFLLFALLIVATFRGPSGARVTLTATTPRRVVLNQ
jgi:cbb3-type cytochrome oxidase subunit 1